MSIDSNIFARPNNKLLTGLSENAIGVLTTKMATGKTLILLSYDIGAASLSSTSQLTHRTVIGAVAASIQLCQSHCLFRI